MRVFIILIGVLIMILTACDQTNNYNAVKIKAEVLETVYAHNKAWTELEDLNEQKKYVHENIVFISPPYKKPITGKEEYLNNYKEWIDHATVHHFKEVNPDVKLYNNGLFAIVTYEIDMSFDYDDEKIPEWHGIDQMTLIKENGKWQITSDMYAKQITDED
jgi:ketosteroid isomerase-like protein